MSVRLIVGERKARKKMETNNACQGSVMYKKKVTFEKFIRLQMTKNINKMVKTKQ